MIFVLQIIVENTQLFDSFRRKKGEILIQLSGDAMLIEPFAGG